jgi:hypothetical protein
MNAEWASTLATPALSIVCMKLEKLILMNMIKT